MFARAVDFSVEKAKKMIEKSVLRPLISGGCRLLGEEVLELDFLHLW